MDTTPLELLAVIALVVVTAFTFDALARWARAKRRLATRRFK